MPLRSDPTLWFNLPGVVAAYQPIGAPGNLTAQYNQAHGGDNRYLLTTVSTTMFSPIYGWKGSGVWAAWGFSTGYTIADVTRFTGIARIHPVQSRAAQGYVFYGSSFSYKGKFSAIPNNSLSRVDYRDAFATSGSGITDGTIGLSGNKFFLNGSLISTMGGADITTGGTLYIGQAGGGGYFFPGGVSAVVFYERPLSDAEMLIAHKQLMYCHVNSDWSVWGRRRRWWFYAPEQAAGAYTQNASGADTPTGAVVKQTNKRVGAF